MKELQVIPLKPNQTVLRVGAGLEILFSYQTPVAAFIPGMGYVKSSKKYSRTTSKHVSQWASYNQEISQEKLDSMVQREMYQDVVLEVAEGLKELKDIAAGDNLAARYVNYINELQQKLDDMLVG